MEKLLNISQTIEGYIQSSQRLFKQVDEELAPTTGILILTPRGQGIKVHFNAYEYDYELSKIPLEMLLSQQDAQETFIKLLPFFDHAYHEVYASQFFKHKNLIFSFVMIFDRKTLSPYERMPNNDKIPYRSMIDAIIETFLKLLNGAIETYLTEHTLTKISENAVIKSAAKLVFNTLLDTSEIVNPFDNISKISSKRYEQTFSDGSILFLPKNKIHMIDQTPSIERLIILEKKIPLTQLRHVRKLLEISNLNMLLLSDGEFILGTVKIVDEQKMLSFFETVLTVDFSHYASWQLSYHQHKIFQVIHGEVYISKPKIGYYKFSDTLRALYPVLNAKQTILLYKLILEATKQTKGTIIVISKNARSEAYRLENQGFIVAPMLLTPDTMASITAIDGAVLMDLDGMVQGLGFILDGMATDKGDSSRGARYNSTIRYVETIANHDSFADSFAVVISEDGDADIITKHTLKLM